MERSDDLVGERIFKDALFEYVERQIWRQDFLGHVVIFNIYEDKPTTTLEVSKSDTTCTHQRATSYS